MKTYLTNCVASSAELIENMVNQATEISYEQLLQEVDVHHLYDIFPWYEAIPLTLETDYSVSFYSSQYDGQECVYVEHSRIEYIFINQ